MTSQVLAEVLDPTIRLRRRLDVNCQQLLSHEQPGITQMLGIPQYRLKEDPQLHRPTHMEARAQQPLLLLPQSRDPDCHPPEAEGNCASQFSGHLVDGMNNRLIELNQP